MKKFKLIANDNPLLKKQMPLYDGDYRNIKIILDDMFEFLNINNGIGLAAPQIGMELNFFIMNVNDIKRCVINPLLIEESKKLIKMQEGCLSFPNMKITIQRPENILVAYNDEYGNWMTAHLDGLEARCFQHEFWHLKGITFDTVR